MAKKIGDNSCQSNFDKRSSYLSNYYCMVGLPRKMLRHKTKSLKMFKKENM